MTTTIDSIVEGFRESLHSVPYGDGELIYLPVTFSSGDLLSLYVVVRDGVALVTDRGLVADQLEDAGVSVDSGKAAKSFAAVRDSVGLPPSLGSEAWEISAGVDRSDLAIAIQAITDAAMRADGLRVLGRSKMSASFADRSVRRLGLRTAVVPRAQMPGRSGERRQVTLAYKGNDDSEFYVQALAGRDQDARQRSYDHTSGLFIGAKPEKSHRIALLQEGRWDRWQVANLREVCRVIDEVEIDDFVDSTAQDAA